jgi:hypothetical protein
MSWKGAARSFAAAGRRIEREQQRRTRVAAQEYKLMQKRQDVANAAQAVAAYEEYVSVLKSIHHDANPPMDWAAMQGESKPPMPVPSKAYEELAQAELNAYEPGFWDRLFKRGPAKRQQLEEAVAAARRHDEQTYAEQMQAHAQQRQEWEERQELTRQVLEKNAEVYKQVLEVFAPFEGIDQLGSSLEFAFTADHIEVDVHVNTVDVVPDFVVTQLASGKMSRKTLPISKFNEIYQDYVCACLLRVAREITAHLPVIQVVVHAIAEQLNSATGLVEKQVIVSAAMPRATLTKLNFPALDPSDAMRNFTHTMKFTKTGGFQAVERVGLAAPLRR